MASSKTVSSIFIFENVILETKNSLYPNRWYYSFHLELFKDSPRASWDFLRMSSKEDLILFF